MTYPRLYILVRNEMDSMNPGKAIAQGSHAATKFVFKYGFGPTHIADIENWQKQGGGFGTKISLETNEQSLLDAVNSASSLGIPSDIVMDPTYPIRDGSVIHLIPIVTAGYIFIKDEETHKSLTENSKFGELRLFP